MSSPSAREEVPPSPPTRVGGRGAFYDRSYLGGESRPDPCRSFPALALRMAASGDTSVHISFHDSFDRYSFSTYLLIKNYNTNLSKMVINIVINPIMMNKTPPAIPIIAKIFFLPAPITREIIPVMIATDIVITPMSINRQNPIRDIHVLKQKLKQIFPNTFLRNIAPTFVNKIRNPNTAEIKPNMNDIAPRGPPRFFF